MQWFKPVGDNDFSMMTPHVTNIFGFYWHFYKPNDNQIYQDGKPASTNLTLNVMVKSPLLGQATNMVLSYFLFALWQPNLEGLQTSTH